MPGEKRDARAEDGRDRRFLPRADLGRRLSDQDNQDVFPGGFDLRQSTPGSYLVLLFALVIIGIVAMRLINTALAPVAVDPKPSVDMVERQSQGRAYAAYDPNIETRDLGRGLRVIGPFNPDAVGCAAAITIDGEPSAPDCLGKILAKAL